MTKVSVLVLAAAGAAAAFPGKLTLGTDYYPEAWDPSIWASDAAAMQAAGISMVRVAEFAWHSFQPNASSAFQFDWLDSALDVLARHNISAIVGTPTASPPSWLIASDTSMQVVDPNGNLYRYGSRQNVNHLHPVFIGATQSIVTAMALHYANDPRVAAFQIDNEVHGQPDYSDVTLAAWQAWLQEAYGTMDALNAAWGTVFWSHTYNTWSDIPLPWNTIDSAHNPGLTLDARRFLSQVAVGYMGLQAGILRQYAPSKPLTCNMMGTYSPVDYSALGLLLDFVAWDNYPAGLSQVALFPGPSTLYAPVLSAAVMRGAKGQQPFYVMEQQASNDGQAVYYGSITPELTRVFAWQQVANGADGVQFFRWRTTRVGFEQHWEGILDWDSRTDNAKYPMVSQLGKEFNLASAAVVGKHVRARVAILLSPDTRWAFNDQPLTNPAFDTIPQSLALLMAFKYAQYGLDVVFVPSELSGARGGPGSLPPAPGMDLSPYDIVLAPTLWVVPDWLNDTLTQFVQDGGHLFLSMRSGSKTASNAYTSLTLPGSLGALAGVQVRQWDPMCTQGQSHAMVLGSNATYTTASANQGRICEILTPTTATVLATYVDGYYAGKPVVTHNKVGDKGGTVLYAGMVSDDSGLYSWMAGILAADAGLPFTAGSLPLNMEVSVRDPPAAGKGPLPYAATAGSTVFIMNFSACPDGITCTATVPAAAGGTDLLTGTTINGAGQVTLPAYGVMVVAV